MTTTYDAPPTLEQNAGEPEHVTAEQIYEELHGRTAHFLELSMEQNISPLAGAAMKVGAREPMSGLKYSLENTSPSQQEEILKREEDKVRGFNKLAHAASAAIDSRRQGETKVVVSRAPLVIQFEKPQTLNRNEFYDNTGDPATGQSLDMMYGALGVRRPGIYEKGEGFDVPKQQSSEERREQEDRDSAYNSDGTRIVRNRETGLIQQMITETPYGITIIEEWGHGSPLHVSSQERSRIGEHRSAEHSVRFIRSKEGPDDVELDRIAHGSERTPQAEQLKGHIDSLQRKTSEKAELTQQERRRLDKRKESRLPFRRPSEDDLHTARIAEGRSRLSAQVMEALGGIEFIGQERLTEGISLQIEETPPAASSPAIEQKPQVKKSMDVRSQPDGSLSLVITEESARIDGETRIERYEIDHNGDLFEVEQLDNGEESRVQVSSVDEDMRFFEGSILDTPALKLLHRVERFVELTNRSTRGDALQQYDNKRVIRAEAVALHTEGAIDNQMTEQKQKELDAFLEESRQPGFDESRLD